MSGWGVACCPICPGDTPLVSTMHFYKAEFYCLDCGATFGFLEPRGADETPALLERMRAYEAEWDTNAAGKLITPRSWRRGCALCDGTAGEYHAAHATVEERAAHDDAIAWIAKRVKAVRA